MEIINYIKEKLDNPLKKCCGIGAAVASFLIVLDIMSHIFPPSIMTVIYGVLSYIAVTCGVFGFVSGLSYFVYSMFSDSYK